MKFDEEFTAIKVDVKTNPGGDVILIPRDEFGKNTLQQILDGRPDTFVWRSMGMKYTDRSKERMIGARFACGGTSYLRKVSINGWATDYEGAFKVRLDFEDAEDIDAIARLREYAWFAGMIVGATSTNEEFHLMFAAPCKECGGLLRNFAELEWKVCDSCAANCDHKYVEGVGQANGQLVHLPFCRKCGRGDPAWAPSDNPLEDMLQTVLAGDIDILALAHPDGSTTTISKKQ
jgi:hypothetical protein